MKTFLKMAMAATAIAIAGCDSSNPNELLTGSRGGGSDDPESTAAGEGNTFDHARESTGGENGLTDVRARKAFELSLGSPTETARLHGAQKMSYVALGKTLTDFGVSLQGGGGKGALTAGALYTGGKNALGAPVYSSRTPEMSAPSTSALAKQMDIFVAAAPDIIANIGKSKRCPGVVLVEADKLTKDGLSCLTGKPVSDDYVALANKMIADVGDTTKGPQIAVATILAASHISE